AGAFVVEDDYARYFATSPVPPPLAALDRHGTVVHINSLTKVLSPNMRVAGLVARDGAVPVPLGVLAAWYGAWHGTPALNGGNGVWLWARTMPFADCRKIRPPEEEAVLCPSQPVGTRPASPYFIWSDWSPLRRVPGHPVVTRADLFQPRIDDLAGDLARRVVIAQPLDYLRLVGEDLRRTLNWRRGPVPGATPVVYNRYVLPDTEGTLPDGVRIPGGNIRADLLAYGRERPETRVVEPAAGMMRAYQSFGFLPGPLFGALVAGALLACATRLAQGVRASNTQVPNTQAQGARVPNTRTSGVPTWSARILNARSQGIRTWSARLRGIRTWGVRGRDVRNFDGPGPEARSSGAPGSA
ncbi:hypothetical protein ACFQ08_36400, partial [Streptosporangium algeriense]